MEEKLITRKDLCNNIGMKESSLRTYITRGTIKESEHGYIDLDNEFNKDYLLKWAAKKGKDINFIFELDTSKRNDTTQQATPPTTTRSKLNDKKYSQALRDKSIFEAELKRIELEKKKDKVIPSEFVQEMMQRYVNGTFGDVVNEGNKLIDDLCNELGADIEIKLKYKKELNNLVTEILKSKHKIIKEEIVEYAKEFALKTKW